jgi:hypothetical protein
MLQDRPDSLRGSDFLLLPFPLSLKISLGMAHKFARISQTVLHEVAGAFFENLFPAYEGKSGLLQLAAPTGQRKLKLDALISGLIDTKLPG